MPEDTQDQSTRRLECAFRDTGLVRVTLICYSHLLTPFQPSMCSWYAAVWQRYVPFALLLSLVLFERLWKGCSRHLATSPVPIQW